jgi:NADPH:quinone reductase-like Zn-dependent oxidoreductase
VGRWSRGFSAASLGALNTYTSLTSFPFVIGNREQAKKMHAAFELSQFRPVINKVFEFEQLKEAYDYSVSGDHIGKIVVKVAQ